MKKPLVTVITVVKVIDSSFELTMNSILGQSTSNYQWIIKSLGPFQNDLLKKQLQKNSRVRIIECDDTGIYDAMNQGLNLADGNYVYFLNSGDQLYSACTFEFIEHILSEGRLNVVYGGYEIEGEPIGYPRSLTEFFFARTALCHQAYFAKREMLLRAGGFNLNYSILADHAILLEAMDDVVASNCRVDFKISRIPKMGFSSTNPEKKICERQRLLHTYFPWMKTPLLRLLLLASLQPVRQRLLHFRFMRKIRSQILKYIY